MATCVLHDGFLPCRHPNSSSDHPDRRAVSAALSSSAKLESLEYAQRSRRHDRTSSPPARVKRPELGCGGVYRRRGHRVGGLFRRTATCTAAEELDLACPPARPWAGSWLRIDRPAIDHQRPYRATPITACCCGAGRHDYAVRHRRNHCGACDRPTAISRSLLRHVRKEAVGLSIVHAWWLLSCSPYRSSPVVAPLAAATVGDGRLIAVRADVGALAIRPPRHLFSRLSRISTRWRCGQGSCCADASTQLAGSKARSFVTNFRQTTRPPTIS